MFSAFWVREIPKLLTAVSLFVGIPQILQFLVLVAMAGGVIAVGSLAARPTRALVMLQVKGKGDFGRGMFLRSL